MGICNTKQKNIYKPILVNPDQTIQTPVKLEDIEKIKQEHITSNKEKIKQTVIYNTDYNISKLKKLNIKDKITKHLKKSPYSKEIILDYEQKFIRRDDENYSVIKDTFIDVYKTQIYEVYKKFLEDNKHEVKITLRHGISRSVYVICEGCSINDIYKIETVLLL